MGIFGFGGRTLYYPGCLTKKILDEEQDHYKEIFNRLGIDFIMLPNDEVCCGLPVINAGHKKVARDLAKKNFELFKKNKVRRIVTNCPSCYHTFRLVYPKFVRDWDIEVEHATVSILEALKRKKISFRGIDEERVKVGYHDPCHLGRYSGIYDEPREVIELLGGKVIEMKNNREKSLCCGGGGGLRANFPDTAKMIAKKRVSQLSEDVVMVLSPCGLCHSNLKTATNKSREFSSFVLDRLVRRAWK